MGRGHRANAIAGGVVEDDAKIKENGVVTGVCVTSYRVRGSRITAQGPVFRGFVVFGVQKLLVTYMAQKFKKYFLQKIAVTGVTV